MVAWCSTNKIHRMPLMCEDFSPNNVRRGGKMNNRMKYLLLLVIPLVFCLSCLHSKASSETSTVSAGVKVVKGKATLKISGKINEEVITKNETKNLSAGDEYKFSLLQDEVVNIIITSRDGNDVEVILYQSGRERKFTVKGLDKSGLFASFAYKSGMGDTK
jgi:hypothetical protein